MGVEGEIEVERALRDVKDDLHIDPQMVVHDFVPASCSATEKVYGIEKSAIDPFHVMQEINRAIRKDLTCYRKKRFTAELHECHLFSKVVNDFQKFFKLNLKLPSNPESCLPNVEITHKTGQSALDMTRLVLEIVKITDYTLFFVVLRQRLRQLHQSSELNIKAFAMAIEEHLPTRSTTQKAYIRTVLDLFKKLKTFYAEARRPIKTQQTKFNKRKWALFYQPENLNLDRVKLLTRFLAIYPELQPYRDLTLSMGSIYRLPLTLLKDQLIDQLPIREEYSDDLKTAIATIKKHKAEILRFREFCQKNPKLPKKCRANTEYINQHFHEIFQSGLYLKEWNRLENEIELQMGGQVRNFISAL